MSSPSCENCPLIKACVETASEYRGFAERYEEDIEQLEKRPQQILDFTDKLGVELDERVAELTYESMSQLSDEDAETIHKEKRQREELHREFFKITTANDILTQISLIRGLQQAYGRVASASESYAAELEADCKKGAGSSKDYGYFGKKRFFCQSGDISPNLIYFEQTDTFKELQIMIEEAQDARITYFATTDEATIPPPKHSSFE